MASLEQARMRQATAATNRRRAELELAAKLVGLGTALVYLATAIVAAIAALLALL